MTFIKYSGIYKFCSLHPAGILKMWHETSRLFIVALYIMNFATCFFFLILMNDVLQIQQVSKEIYQLIPSGKFHDI